MLTDPTGGQCGHFVCLRTDAAVSPHALPPGEAGSSSSSTERLAGARAADTDQQRVWISITESGTVTMTALSSDGDDVGDSDLDDTSTNVSGAENVDSSDTGFSPSLSSSTSAATRGVGRANIRRYVIGPYRGLSGTTMSDRWALQGWRYRVSRKLHNSHV